MKFLLFGLLCLSFTGCASYQMRQKCEKTNWFKHGKDVALRGIRVDADELVNSCKKVEGPVNWADLDLGFKAGMERYCSIAGALDTGRKGLFLNLQMCDPHLHPRLKKEYESGIADFCKEENGLAKGTSGWEYNNICPKELEPQFLVGYKKGRKNYLVSEIDLRQDRILRLGSEIRDIETERDRIYRELARLPRPAPAREYRDADGRVRVTKDPYEDRRDDLENSLSSKDRSIRYKRDEQSRLGEEIVNLRRDLRAL